MRGNIDVGIIERVKNEMSNLPDCVAAPVAELSKVEAVTQLAPEISRMRAKGYSMDAVAEFLSRHGVDVSVAALRSYLSKAKGRTGGKSKRRSKSGAKTRAPVAARVAQHVADRVVVPPSSAANGSATEKAPLVTAPADQKSPVAMPLRSPDVAARIGGSTTAVDPKKGKFTVRPDTIDI